MNHGFRNFRVLIGFSVLAVTGCGAFGPPLPTVESVDLSRYAGRWYEIARYPTFFEQGCAAVTADYTQLPNGEIRVLNVCRKLTIYGELQSTVGVARVVDSETNAKLKVLFYGWIEADYWIIELGEDYEYAVVSEPSRRFLWVLSRTPDMDEAVYEAILTRLAELGFDPAQLIRTPQPDQG